MTNCIKITTLDLEQAFVSDPCYVLQKHDKPDNEYQKMLDMKYNERSRNFDQKESHFLYNNIPMWHNHIGDGGFPMYAVYDLSGQTNEKTSQPYVTHLIIDYDPVWSYDSENAGSEKVLIKITYADDSISYHLGMMSEVVGHDSGLTMICDGKTLNCGGDDMKKGSYNVYLQPNKYGSAKKILVSDSSKEVKIFEVIDLYVQLEAMNDDQLIELAKPFMKNGKFECVTCDHCGKIFPDDKILQQHKKQLRCSICGHSSEKLTNKMCKKCSDGKKEFLRKLQKEEQNSKKKTVEEKSC